MAIQIINELLRSRAWLLPWKEWWGCSPNSTHRNARVCKTYLPLTHTKRLKSFNRYWRMKNMKLEMPANARNWSEKGVWIFAVIGRKQSQNSDTVIYKLCNFLHVICMYCMYSKIGAFLLFETSSSMSEELPEKSAHCGTIRKTVICIYVRVFHRKTFLQSQFWVNSVVPFCQ